MSEPRASYSTAFSSAFDASFDAPIPPEPEPPGEPSNPRQIVVDMLRAALPEDVWVEPYVHDMAAPSRPVVMVRKDRVSPAPAGSGVRDYDFTLILVCPLTTYGAADDNLDALSEDVLYALESQTVANAVVWHESVRGTYGDPDATNPAENLALTITLQSTP